MAVALFGIFERTFRTRYNRTALIRFLLDGAVLSYGFGEGAHSQVTHQHPIVTGAIQTWLICNDTISFFITLKVIVTSGDIC